MAYSPLFADISNNNSEFHPHEYRAAGHILIAIKSTEGVSFVDHDHHPWSLAAGGVHIAVAHYHFARPDLGNKPEFEAQHFLNNTLPLAGGRDYLVLDLERATPQGWAHDPEWSHAFDTHVRAHSRFKTILYASRSTLSTSDSWLAGDPKRIWDADWSSSPDFAPPGYRAVMRQFTDGVFGPEPHALPGVGRGDVNRMSPSFFRTVVHNAK